VGDDVNNDGGGTDFVDLDFCFIPVFSLVGDFGAVGDFGDENDVNSFLVVRFLKLLGLVGVAGVGDAVGLSFFVTTLKLFGFFGGLDVVVTAGVAVVVERTLKLAGFFGLFGETADWNKEGTDSSLSATKGGALIIVFIHLDDEGFVGDGDGVVVVVVAVVFISSSLAEYGFFGCEDSSVL
jgi:hypothetical protein